MKYFLADVTLLWTSESCSLTLFLSNICLLIPMFIETPCLNSHTQKTNIFQFANCLTVKILKNKKQVFDYKIHLAIYLYIYFSLCIRLDAFTSWQRFKSFRIYLVGFHPTGFKSFRIYLVGFHQTGFKSQKNFSP